MIFISSIGECLSHQLCHSKPGSTLVQQAANQCKKRIDLSQDFALNKIIPFLDCSPDLSFTSTPVGSWKPCNLMAGWTLAINRNARNRASCSRNAIADRRLLARSFPCDALPLGLGSYRHRLHTRSSFRLFPAQSCTWITPVVLSCHSRWSLHDGLQRSRPWQNRSQGLGHGKQIDSDPWSRRNILWSIANV